jgi:hypothetical protein
MLSNKENGARRKPQSRTSPIRFIFISHPPFPILVVNSRHAPFSHTLQKCLFLVENEDISRQRNRLSGNIPLKRGLAYQIGSPHCHEEFWIWFDVTTPFNTTIPKRLFASKSH